VSVPDVDATASKASGLGGQVIVPPQDVAGFARVSLISDPSGALIGLWQKPREANGQHPHEGP
jgi:predicted enzyme related to lactoylglutathione lyase